MSEIMGGKVSLKLVKPHRYRVHYHIFLSGQIIGEIELDHIAWRSGEAELKVHIFDAEMHNHGHGSDAVMTLLGQAFLRMNLNRVYLRVLASNKKAVRCYEKAGFRKEGRLRRLTEANMEEEIFLMGVSKAQYLKHTQPWAV
ncbi:MAG: GNAT family protein [Bacillota bacterium]|jgi:RimJ/RimL family protein N-acetyltransferase|nr:GNAT family protein [Bacillota bacterium]HHT91656.1 GNAT family N-acetyltransferase [Bacillota bacterium]